MAVDIDLDDVRNYDFEIPKDLVAQYPLEHREDARLMWIDRTRHSIEHHHFRDLPELLSPGDLLVLNDTKVIPARLVGLRQATGGRWHGLFLEQDELGNWKVLGKTRGHLKSGETIVLQNRRGVETLRLTALAKLPAGAWVVRPQSDRPTLDLLNSVGRIPLPHYIRGGNMVDTDEKDYQTVFAAKPGSVAAPTAGLHFSKNLIERLIEAQISITRITLHVGTGTFRPIATRLVSEHEMHQEWGQIDDKAIEQIHQCRQRDGRVIAVGTTSVRLLETMAKMGDEAPWQGLTTLFIKPPFEFRCIQGMITNFHLPRTTLLVMVRTFGGQQLMQQAYETAIREKYRFFSYGDGMIIV